ncbi:MAG: autotransporter-associated beta strand repeat-containing protein [Verrucomicrobiaceae bacterium]|nr:autotransporter-associated beta strand repeat-containing protein [Verrucomicrobiaceae bacterium]
MKLTSNITLALVLAFWASLSTLGWGQSGTFNFNGTNANATTWASAGGGIVTPTAKSANGSNVLTEVSSLTGIVPGMIVTGSGIPGNTVVTAVGSPANTVTMSLNCTATNTTAVTYTFTSPWNFTRTGTVTVGTQQITNLITTADLTAGMKVTGPGLTGAATISQITSPTEVEIFEVVTSTPNPPLQTYTFAKPTTPGGVGQTVTINLDFGPGRNIPGAAKDLGVIQHGVTSYVLGSPAGYTATLDSDPIYSSLNVNVVAADTGVASLAWSTIRGSSDPGYAVTYNPTTRVVQVTFSNAALVNSSATGNVVGKTIRASYTTTTIFTNKQIGDAVERIGQTDGTTLVYGPVTLANSPTLGSLVITDGVFMWSEHAGSTNAKQFQVAWNAGTRQVTVTYDVTGSAPSGRTILASYARSGAPAVTLGTLFMGDISGGETVGVRLNSLTLQGQTTGTAAKIIKTVGGDDEIFSGITLNSNAVLAVRTGGNAYSSFRIGGSISGSGSLIKRDSGNVTLMGNNTYTGSTYIPTTGGTTFLRSAAGSDAAISSNNLFIGNSNRDGNASAIVQLEASEQINDSATIRFDGVSGRWAYLKMMGNSEEVGQILDYSSNGVIENVEGENALAANATLTISGNANSFYNGYMRDKSIVTNPGNNTGTSTGNLNLVKNGSGMLTLQGNQISYTGTTHVNSGTLRLVNINNPLGNLPTGFNSATSPRFGSDITNSGTVELSASTDWAYGSELVGAGNVIKTGTNTVRINNELDYTGNTEIRDGTLRLQGGLPRDFERDGQDFFVLNASDNNRLTAIIGSGRLSATPTITINGGTLLIDNNKDFNERDGVSGSYGRIHNTAAISATGGTLQFNHNAGEASYSETVGNLTVGAGRLLLQMSRADDTRTSEFTVNTITHTLGGTLTLQGSGVGGIKDGTNALVSDTRNVVKLTTTPPGGLAGGTILGGWAVTVNSKLNGSGTAITDTDFVTLVGGKLQAFDNYDTVSGSANQQNKWTGTNNIRIETGNVTISGQGPAPAKSLNRTINSLYFDSGTGRTLNLGSRTLTINSGGIIGRGNNHTISNGVLTGGNAGNGGNFELFTYVADGAGRLLTISASVRNNGSNPVTLVKSGPGRLILSNGSNTYTGGTYVNEGILELRSIGNLGQSVGPKSDFLFLDGGVLSVSSAATSTITFDVQRGVTIGSKGGSIAVPSGKTLTIESPVSGSGELILGGAGAGTGTLVLSGENTFTGRLRLDIGTLVLDEKSGVNSGNQFESVSVEGGTLIVRKGSVLPARAGLVMNRGSVVIEDNATFGALSGVGTIVTEGVGTGPLKVTFNQDENTTFSGNIGERANFVTGNTTVLGIEKRGQGLLRLTEANSSFTGATVISQGVLGIVTLSGRRNASSLGTATSVPQDTSSASLLRIADGAGLAFFGDSPSFAYRSFEIGTGSVGAAIYANGSRLGDILMMRRSYLRQNDDFNVVLGEDRIAYSSPNQDATLVLGGTNGGLNAFELPLADNGTGKLNLVKSGTGTWLLGEADEPEEAGQTFISNYSGQTTIYGGTLRVVRDTALGAAGGPEVALIGGNLDIDTNYTRSETIAMQGGRLRTFAPAGGQASWVGDVRLDVSSTIEVFDNMSLEVSGIISGTSSLRKEGFGTLIMAGNNTFRGATTVAEGTLRLRYQNDSLSKLADGAGLVLGGGRGGGVLDIVGGLSSIREDVSSLTLSRGQNRITRSDPASGVRLRLNGFGINTGAVLDIQATPSLFADTDRNNVHGILGGWATYGGTTWAMNNGDSTDQPITGFSSFLNDVWQPRAQTTVTQSQSLSSATTNSLRFNAPQSTVLTLTGDNRIFTNAIMQTPAVGENSNLIQGGRLLLEHNREGGYLYLHQNDPNGSLTISSEIANGASISGALFDFSASSTTLNLTSGTTAKLVAGMPISGPGIPNGATILDVTPTSIEISSPTTALGSNVAPHLNGEANMVVTTTSGSGTLNLTSGTTAGLVIGQPITGLNIPSGTFITGYTPSQVFMSIAATGSSPGVIPVTGGVNNLVVSTTIGSTRVVVTSGSVRDLYVGMPVTGPGIPAGAVIASFSDNVSFNLTTEIAGTSAAATATASNVVLEVSGRNGFLKSGTGTAFLTGPNTFSGGVEIVGGTLSVPVMNNGGTVGPLGTSLGAPDKLIISSASLQYTGNSASTDRGFQVNELANIDIALSGTDLTIYGNVSGGVGGALGRLQKSGIGTLTIQRNDNSGGSGNLGSFEVLNGTLVLAYNNANQENVPNQGGASNRFASNLAGLTVGGGIFELRGLDDTPVASGLTERSENRSQQLFGGLVIDAGASTIRVTGGINTTTLLELQDSSNPQFVDRRPAGTVLFVENPNGGSASIRLAVPAVAASLAIPWATYQDTSYVVRPGVNNFAAIEPADNSVISADSKNLYRIRPDVSIWTSVTGEQIVSEAADAFNGITPLKESYSGSQLGPFGLRYFSPKNSLVTVSDELVLMGGAILVGANSGASSKLITGGQMSSLQSVGRADVAYYDPLNLISPLNTLLQYEMLIHNHNPEGVFRIDSVIADQALGAVFIPSTGGRRSNPVNFVHVGTGTTTLGGNNTYTGHTFANGGVILLQSSGALPGGIGVATTGTNLRFDGGLIGLGTTDTFARTLGSGPGEVQWFSSGGFAAFGGDRTVNLGGNGSTVTWGVDGFVADGSALLLGSPKADGKVTWTNPINLGGGSREVFVNDGTAAIDADLAGNLSGLVGSLHKVGYGTLRISGNNTHTGGLFAAAGTTIVGNGAIGTGVFGVASTSNTKPTDFVKVVLEGGTVQGKTLIGGNNNSGATDVRVSGRTTFQGVMEIGVGSRPNFNIDLGRSLTVGGAVSNGSLLVTGGGTLALHGNWLNNEGNADNAFIDGGAVVRHGTLIVGQNDAAGSGTAVELGDIVRKAGNTSSVHRSTAGRSLGEVGGNFDPTSSGVLGSVNGKGAFLFPNKTSFTINGYTYTQSDAGTATGSGKYILVEGENEHPERNGVYQVTYSAANGGTLSLVRVSDFDDFGEIRYGVQFQIETGSDAGATYYVATQTVTPNQGAVHFRKETSLSPNVAFLADAAGLTLSNPIDINATNGTGSTTIGGAASLDAGTTTFAGKVTLQNINTSGVDEKAVRVVSETQDGVGILFSGLISEAVTADRLSLVKEGLGVVTLTESNTFKGGVIVESGSLIVSNTSGSGTGSGAVRVRNPGSLLGGAGFIAGSTTLETGTLLSPGDSLSIASGLERLSFGDDLSLGNDTTVILSLGSSSFDSIGVAGELELLGTTLFQILLEYTPAGGAIFDLIDWGTLVTGSGALSDALDLPELAASTLYWNTSRFDTHGELEIAVGAGGATPPPVRFAVKAARAIEGDTIRVAIQSNWPAPGPITIGLAYPSGSDVTGPASVVIPDGLSSAVATITVTDDPLTESEERHVVRISSVSAQGIKGSPAALTITVTDNDSELPIGSTWTLRNPLPVTAETIHEIGMRSGSAEAIAVGSLGTLLRTSDDGVSWTKVRVPLETVLYGVTWTGTEWIAVGQAGIYLTSPNGQAWTVRSLGTSADLRDVAFINDQIYVVGDNGSLYSYSYTLGFQNWVLVNSGTSVRLNSVAGNLSRIVAVGNGGVITSSPDGVTWAVQATTTTNNLLSVAASASGFVAAGVGGAVETSSDGLTWTAGSTGSVETVNDVYWNGTTFLAVGTNGIIRSSSNGISWAASGTANPTEHLMAVAFGGTAPGRWTSVGEAGLIHSSTNGTTWTRLGSGITRDLEGVVRASAQNTFVAFGASGALLTSPDGRTWTERTVSVSKRLLSGAASATRIVVVGEDGTLVSSTNNGATWTVGFSTVGVTLESITFAGGIFVAVGVDGTIITSPDGVGWTVRPSDVSQRLNSVTSRPNGSGTQFVTVGATGVILVSSNGFAWVPASGVPTSATLNDVAWTGSQFVAVGTGGVILTSSDGDSWVRRASGVSTELKSVAQAGTKLIAVGVGGVAVKSANGSNWSQVFTSTGNALQDLAYEAGSIQRAVAVGSNGLIITSEITPAPPPQAFFALAQQSVFEGNPNKINVQVLLNPAATVDVKVPITVASGSTAFGNVHYKASLSSPLLFKKGQTSANLVVTLINDAIPETNREVTFVLGTPTEVRASNPPRPPVVAAPFEHVFTIVDDDQPLSVTDPVQQIVPLGQPFTLNVSAAGGDRKTVQWRKNAANLAGAMTETYSVPAATVTHGGRYDVKVTNPAPDGSMISNGAEVVVIGTADSAVPVAAGSNVTLKAIAGGSGLTYRWRQGGVPLSDGGAFSGTSSPTLIITGFGGGTEGDYDCEITCAAADPDLVGLTGLFRARVALQPSISLPSSVSGGLVSGSDITGVVGTFLTIPPVVDPDPAKAPTSFKTTAKLPAGLKFDSKTGVVSGTPTTATLAPVSVTIEATNPSGLVGTYTFNLTIQPVPGSAIGTFAALLDRQAIVNGGHGGRVDIVTNNVGAYTASVTIGGVKYSAKGNMNTLLANPTGSATINRKAPLAPLNLAFVVATGSNTVTGTVSIGADSAPFSGWRNVWSKATPATSFKGLHNIAMGLGSADDGKVNIPQGTSFAAANIKDTTGMVALNGKAADGMTISTAAPVGPAGQVLLYTAFYKGTGSLTGVLQVNADAAHTVVETPLAQVQWSKATQVSATERLYKAGWATPIVLGVTGGLYTAPVAKPVPTPPVGTAPQVVLGLQARGNRLFVARQFHGAVANVGVDGTSLNNFGVVPGADPVGVAVDQIRGKIYWTTATNIGVANFDGTGVVPNLITLPVGSGAGGITVDPENGRIFWAQTGGANNGGIMTALLDGTGVAAVTTSEPAVDVAAVYNATTLYYVPVDSQDILSVDYNGQNPQTAVDDAVPVGQIITGIGVLQPQLLPGIYDAGRIYWAFSGGIDASNLGGGDNNAGTLIVTPTAPSDVCVDPISQRIYWTAGNVLGRAGLDGLGASAAFVQGLGSSGGIDIGSLADSNAIIDFNEAGIEESATNAGGGLRIVSPATATFIGSNVAKLTVKINPVTGAYSGGFTLVDAAGKRTVKYAGIIVPNPVTHTTVADKLDGIGWGYFLLNQLPSNATIPATTLKTSPILSGQALILKAD